MLKRCLLPAALPIFEQDFFTCPACRNVLFLQKRRKSNRRQKSGMLLGVSDGRVASFLPKSFDDFFFFYTIESNLIRNSLSRSRGRSFF